MSRVPEEAIKQLFTEARSFSFWLPQDVTDQQLREVYDLLKWGPTSANSCPARFVFVRSGPEKDKLIACLAKGNVEKVKTAPVTAIIAWDERFYDHLPTLFPHSPAMREMFASNPELAGSTAFRNSALQGAYFMMAARAAGLDCGPMSGFDNQKLDQAFFAGTSWKSNFICALGHGDRGKLYPRGPRLAFDEACKIV